MTEILNSQTESLFKLHSYSKKQTILLYAVPILLLIFISIAYLTSGNWLAGNDSVIYMEMAQYCYQGDGFSMCYSSGLQPDLVYPVGAWPPGYSLLMIPFIAAGLSPYYAGLTVSILSSIGFFFIILYFFSKIFPFEFALTAGIGTLLWQTGCLVFVGSEPSFLFFSSLSIYFLERGIDKKSRFHLFLSGILCGWSVTIRHAALALVAAELIWLFLQPNWKKKYSTLFLWLIGVVLGGGWLVCRNIHTFGTAFPHCQGEPTQSFIVRFVKETITFLTGSYPIHKNFLVLSLLGVIFIAFFAALTFGILRNGKKNRISFVSFTSQLFRQYPFVIFWLLYLLGIAGITILSCSRYCFGVESRYWVPVNWVKSVLVLYALYFVFRQFYTEKTARRLTLIYFSLGVSLLVLSLFIRIEKVNAGFYDTPKYGEKGILEQKKAAERLTSFVPPNQLVITYPDYPHTYWRIWGKRYVRRIKNQNLREIQEAERSGLLWGFVVVDPDDFIPGFDEEAQNKLIVPLLNDPSQFPQYEVILLSPVIKAYHYIGPTSENVE